MAELKNILNRIYEAREDINKLVVQKHNLNDPEVISASEELDELINLYLAETKENQKGVQSS